MFTSLGSLAIKFLSKISEYAKTSEAENSPHQESQQRKKQTPEAPKQNNNKEVGMGKFLRGLMPKGVFVQAEDRNTGQTVRREFGFGLPTIYPNIRHQVKVPTPKEVKESAKKSLASIKATAGNAGGVFARAYGVASEGFTRENFASGLGDLAGVANFFASSSSSPSGSPSAFSAQNLRSGLSFKGSESMATTTKNAAKALAGIFASSGGTPTYASRYVNPVSVSGGWLSR